MIKRSLFIGTGLVVVLALSYITFLDVSENIRKDLLERTKIALADKGIEGIEVKIQGEGLALSRTITLTGVTYSQATKEKIENYVYRVDGIGAVDNQIVIQEPKYYVPVHTAVRKIQPAVKSTEVQTHKMLTEPITKVSSKLPKEVIVIEPVTTTPVVTTPKLPDVVKTIEVSNIKVVQPTVVTPVVQPPKVVEPVHVTE
jgi:hypothetical protein